MYRGRHLVGRHALATIREDLIGRRGEIRFQDDRGSHQFAFDGVGRTIHGGFSYRRVPVQRLFHFGRPHLEARHVDHVLQPIHDEDIALLVHRADVPGVEPPVTQGVRRVVGFAPITLHHTGSADDDFAPLAQRQIVIVRVHDLQFEILDRGPDAPELVAEVVIVTGERRALGQAVPFIDRPPEPLRPPARDFLRHRGRGRELVPDRREIVFRQIHVEQCNEDGGHAKECRHAVALDRAEHVVGDEPAVEDEGRAGGKGGVHDEVLTEHVKQR